MISRHLSTDHIHVLDHSRSFSTSILFSRQLPRLPLWKLHHVDFTYSCRTEGGGISDALILSKMWLSLTGQLPYLLHMHAAKLQSQWVVEEAGLGARACVRACVCVCVYPLQIRHY
jgi:hypothetical protein